MSRNFDSDNPKKNRLMRRKRPSYESGVRDDGARLYRRKPVNSRSKYESQTKGIPCLEQ